MTIDEIKELILVFNESGVAEMEIQRGGNSLRLKRAQMTQEIMVPMPAPVVAASAAMTHHPAITHGSGPAYSPALPSASAKPATADDGHELVKSPIVGTYYDAPSPGAPPFVRV